MTAAPHEQFSNRYRYYVLALLTLGYVFNFVDRQVMTILLEPIKADWCDRHPDGFTLGSRCLVLRHVGFTRGALADRWSRTKVLSISMTT